MKKCNIYNNVSVTIDNEHTANHCVNASQLANSKKFNFIIEEKSYIVLPDAIMSYIASHPKCVRYKHYTSFDDDLTSSRHASVPFYLIPDDYIISNAV